MEYEEARKVKIEIIGHIQEWAEETGIETSGFMEAELAEKIYSLIILPLCVKLKEDTISMVKGI